MKLQTVETWVLWFMIYSIIGWIYETTMRSVKEKRFVNRGFLSGPYCPIYGSGAVIVLLVLGKVQNVFLLFFASVLPARSNISRAGRWNRFFMQNGGIIQTESLT